eukprot:3369633-Rhodomonas_salina.2
MRLDGTTRSVADTSERLGRQASGNTRSCDSGSCMGMVNARSVLDTSDQKQETVDLPGHVALADGVLDVEPQHVIRDVMLVELRVHLVQTCPTSVPPGTNTPRDRTTRYKNKPNVSTTKT